MKKRGGEYVHYLLGLNPNHRVYVFFTNTHLTFLDALIIQPASRLNRGMDFVTKT